MTVDVVPFQAAFQGEVSNLIVGIQRGAFYQVRSGNFWVALSGARVVGTISLLDIGNQQGALRKMFVHRDFRGAAHSTATPVFLAAHRFYARNGFGEVERSALPPAFPIMTVDTKFFHRRVVAAVPERAP